MVRLLEAGAALRSLRVGGIRVHVVSLKVAQLVFGGRACVKGTPQSGEFVEELGGRRAERVDSTIRAARSIKRRDLHETSQND